MIIVKFCDEVSRHWSEGTLRPPNAQAMALLRSIRTGSKAARHCLFKVGDAGEQEDAALGGRDRRRGR